MTTVAPNNGVVPNSPVPSDPTSADMQKQADKNFARQVALDMVSQEISDQSNAEKTVHETLMAVITNFK